MRAEYRQKNNESVRELEIPHQIFDGQLNIAKDRTQETGAERFPGMHRDCGHPTICMSEENVTASGPHNLKTQPLERTHCFFP